MVVGVEVLARDDRRDLVRVRRALLRHVAGFHPSEHDVDDPERRDRREQRGDQHVPPDHHGPSDAGAAAIRQEREPEHEQRGHDQRPQIRLEDVQRDANVWADACPLHLQRGHAIRLQRPCEGRIRLERAAHPIEHRQRRCERRGVGFDERLEVFPQRELLADAADRQAGRAGKDDAGVVEESLTDVHDVRRPVVGERRAAAIGGERIGVLDERAEVPGERGDQRVARTVRGELEQQMTAAVRRRKHRQAGEMNGEIARFARDRLERGVDGLRGRIAQRLDQPARGFDMVLGHRTDDGDERLAHWCGLRMVTTSSSRNGPTKRGLPTAMISCLRRRETSSGNCTPLMSRPAHGCRPPPKCM